MLVAWALILASFGVQDSLEELVRQLDDSDVARREEATSKLKARPLSDLAALEDALRKAKSGESRARLAQALPSLRVQKHEKLFGEMPKRAQEESEAIQALRRLDASEARRLLKGRDGMEARRILAAMLDIFREDEDLFGGTLEEHPLLIPPEFAGRVARFLPGSRGASTASAIRCLTHFRAEHGSLPGVDWRETARTVEAIATAAGNPAQVEALGALAVLGDEGSVAALLEALKGSDEAVQVAGLSALRRFVQARPTLAQSARSAEPLLSSKSIAVRRFAYEALSVAPRPAEDRLRVLRAFSDEPSEVRWGALELAAALRDGSLSGDIAKLLPEKEGAKAVEVLFRISTSAVGDHLLDCLKHRATLTKDWVDYLREYEEPAALEPLRRALGDAMSRGDVDVWSNACSMATNVDAWFDAESVTSAASSPDWLTRSSVFNRIGTAATVPGLEVLRKGLKDEEESVRREAIRAVGRARATALKSDLLESLKGEVKFTQEILEALVPLCDHGDLPRILPFMTSRECGKAAREIVAAVGTSEEAPALLDAARELEKGEDKAHAVAGAAKLLGERAIDTLRRLVDERRLRGAALAALAERGVVACAPEVARYLSDSDPAVVNRTAELVGHARYVEAIPQLLGLLDDRHVRYQVAEALARMPREKVAMPTVRYLESRDPSVREAAARILSACDADELVDKIKEVLGDSSPEVARYGVVTVARRRLKAEVGELQILSRHSDSRLRRDALVALAELDWPGQRAKLLDRLRKRAEGSLKEIAPLFAARNDDEPIPLILERIAEKEDAAYDALVALNAFRKPEAYAQAAAPSQKKIWRSSSVALRDTARSLGREAKIPFRVEIPVPPAPRASFNDAFREAPRDIYEVAVVRRSGGGGSYSGSWGPIPQYSVLDQIREALGMGNVPILEGDSVRIVTTDQARAFWRAWAAERRGR